MIQYSFIRQIEEIRPFFSDEMLKSNIIMTAKEDLELKAACLFYYRGEMAYINGITYCSDCRDILLMEGLFRSVMYHLMEMGCCQVIVRQIPDNMKCFFDLLGFEKKGEALFCADFPKVLFSGCQSCADR